MLAPFSCDDIHIVKELKANKVWKLINITGDEELVIKIDANEASQIKDANRVAKVIDPMAKVKILSLPEVNALKEYVRIYQELSAYFDAHQLTCKALEQTEKESVANLKKMLDDLDKYPEPFVKMQSLTVHNLEEAAIQRSQGNKELVKDFASILKAQGGLEKLGEVVAVDMFNDNTDRFYPGYNTTRKFGTFNILLKVCVNPGNVMMALNDQNNLSITILDFIDPQSNLKTYNAPITGAAAGINAITDRRLRKQFAKDIISDLESFLHPKKSKYSVLTKLGSNAATRLERGMVQGMNKIRAKLSSKYPGGLPGSVANRLL
jgi:hypothetical protein